MFKKCLLIFLILLLVLVSLFPRSIEVLNGNPLFKIDQGRDYIAVKNIVVDHKLTLIGAEVGAGYAGLSYLFHGPGYFYLLALPFILFGGNPVGGVYLMLLLGLSAIAFGSFFVTKYWGLKEGLLMGFLLALCPYLIGQSRFIENHFGTPIFILLVFYFTFLFTKNQKNKLRFLFFAALISASIYNLELAIAIPLSVSLLIYSIFILRKKMLFRIPFLLSGFLIGFFPMILFEFRHGFMGIRSLISYLFAHQQASEVSKPILTRATNIANLFLLSFSDSFPQKLLASNSMLPLLALSFFILVFFVLIKEKDKVKKKFILFLLLLFPINFIIFLLLRNIVFQHYITDLVLAFLLLFVYSLSWLYKNHHLKLAIAISAYLLVLFAIGGYDGFKASLSDYYDYGAEHKLKGKIDAIDYIYKDANKKPFSLFVFSPPIYTYPYDYLVWWKGEKRYGYLPGKEKKGIFYLLIEKDGAKPWSYKGWEETVIKSGKVIYAKTLPSGLIVEKRIN